LGRGVVPVLVERDRELAAIARALDSALAGSGETLLVEGEAGIGKTRLLAEARVRAEARGLRCLSAQGAVLERSFAFGVIRQLLEPALRDPDVASEILTGAAAVASPVLGGPPAATLPPQDLDSALIHAIYWVCANLSEERPTALLVDDLQWADQPSARALEYIGQRVGDHAIVLILGSRGEAVVTPGSRLQLGSEARIRPSALSETGSGRMLEDLLGPSSREFSSAAHTVTRGNPFLLREVALATASGESRPDHDSAERISELGPASVADWTLGRLARLPRHTQTIAASLAVLERAELRVAAAHAGLDPATAADSVDELAAIGLVEAELPLRFAHPIVRSALYEQLAPGARERAHWQAAEVLYERKAPAEQVAAHLLQTEPRGQSWAAAALRMAAGAARGRGGAEEAIAFLRRALDESSGGAEPSLLLELGLAELAASDSAALEHLEAASEAGGPPELQGTIHGALAQSRYLAGDTLGAFEAVRAALGAIAPGTGGAIEAELLFSYGIAGRPRAELMDEVRGELATPRSGPRGEPTAAEVVRRHLLGLDCYLRGERERALAEVAWAAERMADPELAAILPSLTGTGPAFVLAGVDAHADAERLIVASLERARRRGSRLETAEALHDRVWSRWRRGDLIGGLADAETIFAMTEGAWEVAKLPLRIACADMKVERGELEEAAGYLDLPESLESEAAGTWGWGWLPLGRAKLAAARRDWHRALELSLTAGERLLAIDAPSPGYCWWRSDAARAANQLGQTDRAVALATEQTELGRRIGSPRAIGVGLVTLGSIRGGKEGIELLRESLPPLETAGAALERARALLWLGIALRRDRHARDAREPLRTALDLSGRLGATPLAEVALAELRAAGGRPRRERSTGLQSLTPRERQVAELAGSGLSNPEIAEQLFITRKTVEAHLRVVFRKLDLSSRDQLRSLPLHVADRA
jgi:DNA-binding CsgD family transcriptional regulator